MAVGTPTALGTLGRHIDDKINHLLGAPMSCRAYECGFGRPAMNVVDDVEREA